MTLGPLMVDVAGHELTPEDRGVLAHPLVGSVILFTRNYDNPRQLEALVRETAPCASHHCSSQWITKVGACSASGAASRSCRRSARSATPTISTPRPVVGSRGSAAGTIKRHQLVYSALGDAVGGEIHALSLETPTPEECSARRGG